MRDHRLRLNDEDDEYFDEWPEQAIETQPTTESVNETLAGQDAKGIVTVNVTHTAEVVSVNLSPDWKKSVDPRSLHASVLAASNAAIMQALTKQVEDSQHLLEHPIGTPAEQAPAPASADEPPLSQNDVLRLLNEVTADLDQFFRKVSEGVDQAVSATSGGEHVRGKAERGHLHTISIEPGWASNARPPEIESEILDFLRRIGDKSAPGELAKGPQSKAVDELNALVADPQALLRRLGLPTPPATGQPNPGSTS